MDDLNSSAGRGAGKPGAARLLAGIARTAASLPRDRRQAQRRKKTPKKK